EKLLEGQKSDRFIRNFKYMSIRFHWGNFYRIDDGGKSGQLGWAYSLALLSKYGDQGRPPQFYSLKLRRAFEDEFHGYDRRGPGGWDFHYAYEARFVDSFAHWFGLVDIERKKDPVSFHDQL